MEIKYKIYLFVQDQCSVCKAMKKEYNLEESNKNYFQNILIQKTYPRIKHIDKFDLKHVPTLVIVSTSRNEIIELTEYKHTGFLPLNQLISVIEKLKKGDKLYSNIQY